LTTQIKFNLNNKPLIKEHFMENQQRLMEGVERLSENEKLELFKVEELETRLEMAALSAGSGSGNTTCNTACATATVNAGCW
jgi:hypothetical protein